MLQCDPLLFTTGFSFTNISQQEAHINLHSTISNSPIFIQRPSSRDISILTKSKQLFSSIRPCKYNLRSSANIWSASIFCLYAFQKKGPAKRRIRRRRISGTTSKKLRAKYSAGSILFMLVALSVLQTFLLKEKTNFTL